MKNLSIGSPTVLALILWCWGGGGSFGTFLIMIAREENYRC